MSDAADTSRCGPYAEDDIVWGKGTKKNVFVERKPGEEIPLGLHLNEDFMVFKVDDDGQCFGKVFPGDVLVGVNGQAVTDITSDAADPEAEFRNHVAEQMKSAVEDGHVFLTFNTLTDDAFLNLLKKGFHVRKVHNNGWFTSYGDRVFYCDEEGKALIIGKKKGESTKKVFSFHEINHAFRTHHTRIEITASNGDSVVMEFENEAVARMIVARVHSLILCTHCAHDNRHKMEKHTDGIESSSDGTSRGSPWYKRRFHVELTI